MTVNAQISGENTLTYSGLQRELPKILRHAADHAELFRLRIKGVDLSVELDSACERMEAKFVVHLEPPDGFF